MEQLLVESQSLKEVLCWLRARLLSQGPAVAVLTEWQDSLNYLHEYLICQSAVLVRKILEADSKVLSGVSIQNHS